jgi:hypothetical protein
LPRGYGVKIRETPFKPQALYGLQHLFGHIDQLGLLATKTNALYPDMEHLQSAHIDTADLRAVNAAMIGPSGLQLPQ